MSFPRNIREELLADAVAVEICPLPFQLANSL